MKGRVNMWRVLLAGLLLAFWYRRAAQRDEKNGLPFTAAMEWRNAAELSSWITLLANRYWREWERIMHLPRRLAEPLPRLARGPGVTRKANPENRQFTHSLVQ